MPDSPALKSRLWKLLTILWVVFLVYGPVCLFIAGRFNWQIMAVNRNILAYNLWPLAASWLCAPATAAVLLFRAPLKAILPAIIFLLSYALAFSSLGNTLEVKSFADFSKPEAAYVKKHCNPMNFVQDGKTYTLGICDLVINHNGLVDFNLIYDTSGDIGNFNNLSPTNQKTFAMAIRKSFNDDPNEDFEIADFTAPRYHRDFFWTDFDGSDTEGFRRAYGPPPKNSQSPYPFIFEGP